MFSLLSLAYVHFLQVIPRKDNTMVVAAQPALPPEEEEEEVEEEPSDEEEEAVVAVPAPGPLISTQLKVRNGFSKIN